MITVEQIVNTQKTNIETLFGLTGKAFEGVEKLVELNIQAPKSPKRTSTRCRRPPSARRRASAPPERYASEGAARAAPPRRPGAIRAFFRPHAAATIRHERTRPATRTDVR